MDAQGAPSPRIRGQSRHALSPAQAHGKNGWLSSKADTSRDPKATRSYTITKDGRAVLKIVRKQLKELGVEVGRHGGLQAGTSRVQSPLE